MTRLRLKYEYVKFPEADVWGTIMSASHPLAKKKSIRVSDLVGEPLFVSEQSWNNEIKSWAKIACAITPSKRKFLYPVCNIPAVIQRTYCCSHANLLFLSNFYHFAYI